MWKDAYLESRILSADPIELIRILYQAALDSMHDARQHLANGDIAARSVAISKATNILSELEMSLNFSAGGDIARRLAALYQYMRMRLLEANVRQDDATLAEIQSLLVTLSEGWSGIQKPGDSPASSRGSALASTNPWNGPMVETDAAVEYAPHRWSA
jgi:flagellar secretion chaperone FliS